MYKYSPLDRGLFLFLMFTIIFCLHLGHFATLNSEIESIYCCFILVGTLDDWNYRRRRDCATYHIISVAREVGLSIYLIEYGVRFARAVRVKHIMKMV